jgi:predicted phage tail component-like protein
MNEVTFNNNDLNDYLIVKRIKESILPPINTIRKTIPGRAGTRYVRKTLGERQIKIDVEIPASCFSSREETINTLASILYTEDEKELKLRDSKTYLASLDGNTDIENIVYNGVGTLSFIASDPIAYGEKITEEDISSEELTNNGNYPTTGKITITIGETLESLEVSLVGTGEHIYIDDDFVATDVVVIDLEAEYVTKNGYLIMNKLSIDSDFFKLPPGKFTITVSSGTADLEFRERWL